GVEVGGGADVAAEVARGAADEHAAVEDERQPRPARVAADRAAELEAVELRHAHVGEDGIHRLALEERQRRLAVGGGEHLVPGVAEDRREQPPVRRNDSVASSTMARASWSVAITTSVASTLGRMWRATMRGTAPPSAKMASTNSRERSTSTCERSTRA